MATEGLLIGGRYQLGETLGRGGMARVYRARDTQLGREVAVKLMSADLADDPVFEARFVNEARSAASISHPNVVTVLDFGTDGPGPYLVMELVEGGDLAKLITAKGSLPARRAAEIAANVASALQAAHAQRIVHRDVKPGNILLGSEGQSRVADFGIARATDEESLTGTGTSLGSVDYLSPEQARGEAATSASDIYSLGVVLYEMLTGRRPFTGETAYAVAVARIEAPPPDPRAINRSIPKDLGAIVQRAMAVEPSGRFASAAEMRAALGEWLDAHPAPKASSVVAAPAPPKADKPRGARAAALAAAALAAAPVPPPSPSPSSAAETRPVPVRAAAPAAAAPLPAPVPVAVEREDRRRSPLLLAAAAILLLSIIGFAGGRILAGPEDSVGGIVVGEPSGGVLAATPDPTSRPTADPTTEPTVEPTVTPAPVAAATPVPAAQAPAPVVTPAPPVVVAMAVSPDQTVATWYSYVEDGEFDAAYSLWSDRMKANFPREGNLDARWRDTADITFSQLYVVSQTQTTATVQVDFVETKDNGSSRRYIGWWELVRSGDGWLLDQPHF